MPVFKVLCRKDAFIDYVTQVEAEDAVQAAALAREDPDAYEWESDGDQEFDASCYATLDDKGAIIEGTECGDF